jgi:hypothetical protein
MMSSSLKRAILAGAVVLVAALPARAQAPEQQVQTALQRAQQAGVPVELLESKIAEGRAKGVPMARIAQAVEQRLAALLHVQAAFAQRQTLTTEELGVAADAAQAGVSDAALQAVVSRAPAEHRSVAIAALSQLVQLGYTPQQALDQVQRALQRGPAALMNLPAQAAAARGVLPAGIPPHAGGRGAGPGGGPPAGTPAGGKPTTTPTPPGGKPPVPPRGGRGGL